MRHYRLAVVLAVILCSTTLAWGDGQRPCNSGRLTGTWMITFHIDERPAFLPDTITILGNFTRDGNFLFSTDLPTLEVPMPTGEAEPVKVGEGHGIWKRTGHRKFQLQSTALVQLALEPETLIGLGGGTAEFHLSKDSNVIQGTIRLQLKPLVGDPLPPGIGELTGRRIFH